MAKHLVFDYTFDASERKLVLDGVYARKRLLLITNTTTNDIIYSFNDSSLGLSDISFDYTSYTTTLTLLFNTTSMSDTDEIQVFVEADAQEFKPEEPYTDPVSKIRVSNPENLIDTDFEYGLQSTKWETLELTKNIPTFYARNGDQEIDITTMTTSVGSNVITVSTSLPHKLQRGSPIITIGSTTVTADGGFLVSSVIDVNTFSYLCKSTQSSTGSILETYTQLFPGSVYSGTEFKLSNIEGITTDSGAQSQLTVSTQYPTNFTTGTSMVLANTFAKSNVSFNTNDVQFLNSSTINTTTTSATATGESSGFTLGGVNSFSFQPSNAIYFVEGTLSVDTSANTITFPSPHGYIDLDAIVYICDTSTNSVIGGLQSCKGYYVARVSDVTIKLQRLRSVSSFYTTSLTSAGVSGGVMKSAFSKTIGRGASGTVGGSGDYIYFNSPHDVTTADNNQRVGFFNISTGSNANSYLLEIGNPWNFNSTSYDYFLQYRSTTTTLIASINGGGRLNIGSDSSDFFAMRINLEPPVDASSLYAASHGINTGDFVTVTATTGTLPSGLSSGTTYEAVRIDENRVSFINLSGSAVLFSNSGTANLVYDIDGVVYNEAADTITVPNNIFSDGDALEYDVNSGTAIGGLVDNTTYYVANKTADRFNLSTTPNALTSSVPVPDQASTSYVTTSSDEFKNVFHQVSTGQAVQYVSLGTPVKGLKSGQIYYGRALSSSSLSLHPTSADAIANTNEVIFLGMGSGVGLLNALNVIDFTSVTAGQTQNLNANFIGAADGIYSVSSTASNQESFTLSASNQIQPRTTQQSQQVIANVNLDAFYFVDHGLITGDSVVYTSTGTITLTGVSSGVTYFVIRKSKDYFQLASSSVLALAGTFLPLADSGTVESTGVLVFTGTTIVGSITGSGTVSYVADSTILTGTDTTFTSYFNAGDKFFVNTAPITQTTAITSWNGADYFLASGHGLLAGNAVTFSGSVAPPSIDFNKTYYVSTINTGDPTNRFQVYFSEAEAIAGSTNEIQLGGMGTSVSVTKRADAGSVVERTIKYVNSDTQLEVTEAFPSTAQLDTNYFLNTSLLLRSDGFALHRPYDGGVELIPSSNPDSRMIRQTRKYFRYQSGKGIQVSFAVNFSPTSQIDLFTRSGTTGTITTRFPHRLTTGLGIVVSGSTNTDQDTIGTKSYAVTVGQNSLGDDVFLIDGLSVTSLDLLEGRTYRFNQSDSTNASKQLLFSTTEDGSNNGGSEYTTNVTKNGSAGSAGAYTQITVASSVGTLYTYVSGTAGIGFTAPTPSDAANNKANLWNGTLPVLSVVNDLQFTVELAGTPSDSTSLGIIEYYVSSWNRSSLRCGIFDDQNGLFFEYDGDTINVGRRSSIQQISGYANVTFRSGEMTGVGTKFSSQLSIGESIVIKGQSHTIIKIASDTSVFISPSYRGIAASKVIVTKTNVTKIPQTNWNLDVCDGTGKSGFKLDLSKIQMAYIDYSWYGAGKVRFGFKDQNGDVKYVHQFVHGNFFTEAYMRSGNLPARYEIENLGAPSYVPALAHWGTSIIMDGRFDNDKAYVFNASSNNVTLIGTGALTASAKIDYTGIYYQRIGNRNFYIGRGLLLDSPTSTLSSVTKGMAITGSNLATDTVATFPGDFRVTPYQIYLPNITSREGTSSSTQAVRSLIVLDKLPTGTSGSSSTYTFGDAASGENTTKSLPLISIRLAPSVDTGTPGFLGEREIINRMQLILNQVGILSTHASEIQLVLNGQLSTNSWQRVTNPSLSQLLYHSSEDVITGGAPVFNFRAAGGTGASARTQVLTTQDLGEVATLGNAILGGDSTYPDGPDVLTVVANLTEDPSTVSASNPFIVSGRISWSESQA